MWFTSFLSISTKLLIIWLFFAPATLLFTQEIKYETWINHLSFQPQKLQTSDFLLTFQTNSDIFGKKCDAPTLYTSSLDNSGLFASKQDTNLLEFNEEESQVPLLPERISFMENFLWGQKGIFRKIGITSELTPEQREKELKWRRTFLTLHQIGGMLSWGLMAGTVISGQLWLDGTSETPDWHKRFLYSTIPIYILTGLLAVTTPPPYQRRDEFSTTSVHKYLAWLHFIGMVATPIVGKLINSSNDYYKTARIHQKIGYVTFSTYTIAMLTILLFR